MDGVGSVGSFAGAQASRAYGIGAPSHQQQQRGAKPVEAVAPVRAVTSREPSRAQSLAAAVVPGGVHFDATVGPDASERGLVSMYTRSADRAEAATRVQVGRVLDVEG